MKKMNDRSAVSFFSALFKNCKGGTINLRFITSGEKPIVKKEEFIPLWEIENIRKILKKFMDCNVYFGVGTRIKGDGTKDGIIQIPALWVDIDLNGQSRKEVWKRIKNFSIAPSIIVRTWGYHLYWLLKNPPTKDQIPVIESLLKRLAQYLSGDSKATDASRMLRVPGTINHKRDGYRARLKRFKPEMRYKISDFDFLQAPKERNEINVNPLGWAERLILNGVAEGERNDAITRLAGRYFGKNLSKIEIRPILLQANDQFNPPLDEKEVEKILGSVMKTHVRKNTDSEWIVQRINYQLITLADVFNYPKLTYLIGSILIERTVSLLAGYPGEGKTILVLSIIKAILTGDPLWDKYPVRKTGPVLLVDEENPQSFLRENVKKMGFTQNLPLHLLHFHSVKLDRKNHFNELLAKIEEVRPILIVIDSLIRVHGQKENEASTMSKVMDRLRKIANLGTTVLIIHHFKKGEGSSSQRIRGSTDIPAGVDMAYGLTRNGDDLVFESIKSRTEHLEPIRLKMGTDENRIEIVYKGSKIEESLSEAIKIVEEKGSADIKEIDQALKKRGIDVGKNALRRELKSGVGKELLERKGPNGKLLYQINPAASRFHPNINKGETVNPSVENQEGEVFDDQRSARKVQKSMGPISEGN